jgi:hypothetical protein
MADFCKRLLRFVFIFTFFFFYLNLSLSIYLCLQFVLTCFF